METIEQMLEESKISKIEDDLGSIQLKTLNKIWNVVKKLNGEKP